MILPEALPWLVPTVTAVATVILAVTSWAGLRATREQSREVLRREHLHKLQTGALAKLEEQFDRFWRELFEGNNRLLKFREDGDPGRPGAPERFDFQDPLREELRCHFEGLFRAISDLTDNYGRFTGRLLSSAEETLSRWVPDQAKDEKIRWKRSMLSYLFTRALRTDHDARALCPSWPVTDDEKHYYLQIVRRLDPDLKLRGLATREVEALRPRYKECKEEFALSREAVVLHGECDLAGESRRAVRWWRRLTR
ncbi:MAG: hypothetical protein ACRD2E_13475 [Terriglobales bacterium]